MDIRDGSFLTCTTASGSEVTMRALGPVVQGMDFPVVWVCVPGEYKPGDAAPSWPGGVPWPLTALRAAEDLETRNASAVG